MVILGVNVSFYSEQYWIMYYECDCIGCVILMILIDIVVLVLED